jgi:chaperone required for assembly of F1-ATPase
VKRVYEEVTARAADGGWGVHLDGRPLRTPEKRPLTLPSRRLAEAIAVEWDAQETDIHPERMPLMRLAATALDRTAIERDKVVAEIVNYAGTDLVCYRAEQPPALAARQHAAWQPLIDWAARRYDAGLAITVGIVPQPQSPAALKAFSTVVASFDDFRLTALQALTGACGSLVIALALAEGRLGADAAFAVSQLDESFQIEAWGEDAEALKRRALLAEDIKAAAQFLELLADSSWPPTAQDQT